MINQIGNEELDYLFEDNSFSPKNKKKRKVNKTLSDLYDSVEISIPKNGTVVPSTYVGKTSDQFLFEVTGYKDFIRVDIKGNEEKYLRNSEFGDIIDVLILNVNQQQYNIRASIASLYESRAHQNLKALEEGESVTALIPPLNKKSVVPMYGPILSGMSVVIYGCPLFPPPILSFPYLRDLRSVLRSIKPIII